MDGMPLGEDFRSVALLIYRFEYMIESNSCSITHLHVGRRFLYNFCDVVNLETVSDPQLDVSE